MAARKKNVEGAASKVSGSEIGVAIDGLFAPRLEGGLNPDVWNELLPHLQSAHGELMRRRGKDIGFFDVAGAPSLAKNLKSEVTRLRSLADDIIVLGIGGSSLGGQALCTALSTPVDAPTRVHFVDNIDPETLSRLLERLQPERTTVLVITKSGGTVETLAQLLIVRRWLRVAVGQGESRVRMTFVTDPTQGLLRELANKEGIRTFEIPSNVGGRYSALTPVGLLPAALCGIDVAQVLKGAEKMAVRIANQDVKQNPATLLAAGAYLALTKMARTSLVFMPYSDALRVTSAWFVQLWAESLGKRLNKKGQVVHAGQTPIAALGATDQHAQLQLFVEGPRDKAVILLAVQEFSKRMPIPDELPEYEQVSYLQGKDLLDLFVAERRATRAALLSAGVPIFDISVPRIDSENLGALLMLLEGACACVGVMLGIDPFDQPGVEAGKRMAQGLLGRVGYEVEEQRVKAREALENRVN